MAVQAVSEPGLKLLKPGHREWPRGTQARAELVDHVELVREAGPAAGLYGAKITGGGSGGTVAVLGRADAGEAVAGIARRYRKATGREPYLFAGSSPGACHFGVRRVGQ